MFIDDKGKLFGKVSIIDILIIVVLAVGITGVCMSVSKINNKKVLSENKSLIKQSIPQGNLMVKMRFKEVRSYTTESVNIGDEVYDVSTKKQIGIIEKIETEPATRIITSKTGEAVTAEVPDRYDLILYVKIPGALTENGYYTASNVHLVYDASFEIKTPTIQAYPQIESIKEYGE